MGGGGGGGGGQRNGLVLTGATQYHVHLGLPDKGLRIKDLVVFNSWNLEPLDLLNGLALGFYHPSPEV